MTGAVAVAVFVLSLGVGDAGRLVRYDPGVFAIVAANRGMALESCNIASPFHDIGDWVSFSHLF